MSLYAIPNEATHATVVTVRFADGSEPDEQVILFADFAACDRLARETHAVSVGGYDKPISEANVSVYPLVPMCGKCGQRHAEACL